MDKPPIHQIVSGFVDGDAISDLAVRLRKIFRGWGRESEILCPLRHIDPKMRGRARDLRDAGALLRPEGILLFHFSIGSETVDYFRVFPGKRVLVYHNITPGRYFHALYDERELLLDQGRKELASLAALPDLSLADSAFNAGELSKAGFGNVGVMPIILDHAVLDIAPDGALLRRCRDGAKNILFVGRVVPNKRYEDLIRAFHAYRAFVGKKARLLLVGSHVGLERYLALLRDLVRELALDDVLFTGHVRRDQLAAYYRAADLFFCMSEHEGFCIPLLEAMRFRIPVLARRAAAVPETLGGSGVLFEGGDFPRIAEMMDLLLENRELRERVIRRQNERLKDFDPGMLERKLRGYLAPWLDS